VDFSETFRTSGFKVFSLDRRRRRLGEGAQRQGPRRRHAGRTQALEDIAKSLGAKGLAFIKVEGGEWKSPIVKFFTEAEKAELTAPRHRERRHYLLRRGPVGKACAILGRARLERRSCS
jgi:aspartyl-tRNA synthetase